MGSGKRFDETSSAKKNQFEYFLQTIIKSYLNIFVSASLLILKYKFSCLVRKAIVCQCFK